MVNRYLLSYLLTDSGHFQKEQWHLLKDTWLIRLFQKKIQTGAVAEDWRTFLKKPWNFKVGHFTFENWELQGKKGFLSGNSAKLSVDSFFGLEISTRPETKTHGNYTWVFLTQLITPRNSTSFLIDAWNFLMLFHFFNIPTPGICMSLGDLFSLPLSHLPLVFEFFWNGMHIIAKKQWAKCL